MGAETELLKWLSLNKERSVLEDTKEKVRLKEINKQIKQHESYMLEQGFAFDINKVILPNGELYEL